MRRPGKTGTATRPGGYDLHVHTTHSDGLCTPSEVVRSAAAVGLKGLAVTDHDTVTAVSTAREEAGRLGIELVAGIELTVEWEGKEIHLLGYFIDPADASLLAETARIRVERRERLEGMADRLRGLGLIAEAGDLRRMFPRAAMGRRHLAEYLVATGQVTSTREAFARYLGDRGPAHIPKPRLGIERGLELLSGAGGVAAVAHPPYDLTFERLAGWRRAGLSAVEVDGPGIGTRLGRRWRDWAKALDLATVAGSDFHTTGVPGRWVGSVTTPEADLERLRALSRPARAESDTRRVPSEAVS